MAEIKFSKKQISQFEKMGVETIYLFGSRAQGSTSPLSDFDIGVVFKDPEKYRDNTMEPYLKLYKIFTEVLPKDYLKRRFEMREHEFDLVFLQFASISLQLKAIQEGKVIYGKDREKRFQYQEYVLRKYLDFKHFFDIQYKALLERI